MEQARRSALAHHVHRTAPMGPRVLINGIWYYMVFKFAMTAKFDQSELTRALRPKPVIIPTVFANLYATTVSAGIDTILGAPPVARAIIRKLPTPLTAPIAEHRVGQFGLGSGRPCCRHTKHRQGSDTR
jgi:hypothetical protein